MWVEVLGSITKTEKAITLNCLHCSYSSGSDIGLMSTRLHPAERQEAGGCYGSAGRGRGAQWGGHGLLEPEWHHVRDATAASVANVATATVASVFSLLPLLQVFSPLPAVLLNLLSASLLQLLSIPLFHILQSLYEQS